MDSHASGRAIAAQVQAHACSRTAPAGRTSPSHPPVRPSASRTSTWTVRWRPLTGNARFALFACLAEDLSASGVELLVVLSSWLWVTYGTRVFQNVLGFVPCHLLGLAAQQHVDGE